MGKAKKITLKPPSKANPKKQNISLADTQKTIEPKATQLKWKFMLLEYVIYYFISARK